MTAGSVRGQSARLCKRCALFKFVCYESDDAACKELGAFTRTKATLKRTKSHPSKPIRGGVALKATTARRSLKRSIQDRNARTIKDKKASGCRQEVPRGLDRAQKTPWLYQENHHNDKLKTSLKGLRVRRYNLLRLAGLACVRDRETPQEQATAICFSKRLR